MRDATIPFVDPTYAYNTVQLMTNQAKLVKLAGTTRYGQCPSPMLGKDRCARSPDADHAPLGSIPLSISPGRDLDLGIKERLNPHL